MSGERKSGMPAEVEMPAPVCGNQKVETQKKLYKLLIREMDVKNISALITKDMQDLVT